MKAFGEMIVPKRVELPDVTSWTVGAIFILGAIVFGKRFFDGKPLEAEVEDFKIRYDLGFGTIAMGIVYVLVMGMNWLPFVWSTILFVLISGLFLTRFDRSKWLFIGELALMMSFGLHYVFTQLFTIELP